jgi:hypothetical protein
MPADELKETTNPAPDEQLGSTTSPQDGDVIVTHEPGSAAGFTVRQLPAIVQLSAKSRDEAMRIGRSFAQRHEVDVWYRGEDGLHLLEAYRVRAGGGSAPRRSTRKRA